MIRLQNLSRNVNENILREICGFYGSVKNVEFMCFPGSKKLKGVAYVSYDNEEDAKNAFDHLAPQKKEE